MVGDSRRLTPETYDRYNPCRYQDGQSVFDIEAAKNVPREKRMVSLDYTLKAPTMDAIGGQVWVIPLTSESHRSNFLVIRSGANCVPRMLLALIRLAL